MVIKWSRYAGMKFQPIQPGQISPYNYIWKLMLSQQGGTVLHLADV